MASIGDMIRKHWGKTDDASMDVMEGVIDTLHVKHGLNYENQRDLFSHALKREISPNEWENYMWDLDATSARRLGQ